jgi:hypothetical protein
MRGNFRYVTTVVGVDKASTTPHYNLKANFEVHASARTVVTSENILRLMYDFPDFRGKPRKRAAPVCVRKAGARLSGFPVATGATAPNQRSLVESF